MRKPRTGAWHLLTKHRFPSCCATTNGTSGCSTSDNSGMLALTSASTYIGDAAGRPAVKGATARKKDFSASDLKFALNVGLEVGRYF
jgi:hypothetical protein